MKQKIKIFFMLISGVIFLCFVLLISTAENQKESTFSSYEDLEKYGEKYRSWIPGFLPKEAFNIRIYTHVETNYFYMFFQLEKKKNVDFRGKMNIETSNEGLSVLQKGAEGIKSGWCVFQDASDGFGENLYLIGEINSSEESYYLTKASTGVKLNSAEYIDEIAKKYCRLGEFKPEMRHLNRR